MSFKKIKELNGKTASVKAPNIGRFQSYTCSIDVFNVESSVDSYFRKSSFTDDKPRAIPTCKSDATDHCC